MKPIALASFLALSWAAALAAGDQHQQVGEPGASWSQPANGTINLDQLAAAAAKSQQQQQPQSQSQHAILGQQHPQARVQKCSRQSMQLARQTLASELDTINSYNAFWFNDLDKDELMALEKQSLANIIMSGASNELLHADGLPLFEVEASYLRVLGAANGDASAPTSTQPALTIQLSRRAQPDRCYLNRDKGQFTYLFGVTLGPLEHRMDLVYNLPRELRLSQPIDWRPGQATIHVPRMAFEVSLKQAARYSLDWAHCPLELADLTYVGGQAARPGQSVVVTANGLANNNNTAAYLERLFQDYTRPVVTSRLRQALRFYLNSKTLPLFV